MTPAIRSVATTLAASLAACASPQGWVEPAPTFDPVSEIAWETTSPTTSPPVQVTIPELRPGGPFDPRFDPGSDEPAILEMDGCDDETFEGAEWETHTSEHFIFRFFTETAAEHDIARIVAERERAYATIREVLEVEAEPTFEVYLSPNRSAAQVHGRGLGSAYPASGRYEVVYTGAPDGFESTHYGHELTHMLAHERVPSGSQLPIFGEGLAELLDHSGRDMHRAYARQLHNRWETRVRIVEFQAYDLYGRYPGRAGSLVQFFQERYGWEAVGELLGETAVRWSGGCYRHPTVGCVSTVEALEAVLDHASMTVLGESWITVREGWAEVVQAALAAEAGELLGEDRAEIAALIQWMDYAITESDAVAYRRTMEGFYCDWGGEALRASIAERAVEAFGYTTSELVSLRRGDTKNFRTAAALVRRVDEHGVVSFESLRLEHFPVGWRVIWGPDWY